MSTETNSFVSALAQANGFIPSLHNLAVETIKTFVNPGIKELEVKLLDDNQKKLTHNNDLRCIAEQNIEQGIRDLSDQVEERADALAVRQRQHRDYIVELVNEVHKEVIECVGGESNFDTTLYQRVKDIEMDMRIKMGRMESKIEKILEIIEPQERKRRDRNQRKREREREKREKEENLLKKSKI
jgi:hypothetical protein